MTRCQQCQKRSPCTNCRGRFQWMRHGLMTKDYARLVYEETRKERIRRESVTVRDVEIEP